MPSASEATEGDWPGASDVGPHGLAPAELIGAWRLRSYFTRDTSGRTEHPLGPGALGLLIYTSQGQMSGSMMRAGRSPFAQARAEAVGRSGTAEEVRQAFDDFFAYGGTYEFDAETSTVRHHVEICSIPGWEGRTTIREVERNPDGSLVYVTPPREHDGAVQRAYLIWARD